MFYGHCDSRTLVASKKRVGITEKTNLRCRVAEKLLLEYLGALGDSNQVHLKYLKKLKSGDAGVLQGALKDQTRQVRDAREALQSHLMSHDCVPPDRTSARTRHNHFR